MKYNDDYIFETYGIINDTEGTGYYLIPEAWVNTNDEIYFDDGNIIGLDLREFKVDDGDTIALTLCNEDEGDFIYEIELYNADTDTYGYLLWSGSMYDDGRYYLVNKVANFFREYDDVIIQYYLLYNEEEVTKYIDSLERIKN